MLLDVLIHCVVASGLLKQANHLRSVFDSSLEGVAADPKLRGYLKGVLHQKCQLLARATLYRHRLTLHMGFCRLAQDYTKELVESRGGVVSWRTMDLTPQAGVEWLLQGSSHMKQSDLARALELSFMLDFHDENEEAYAKELSSLLVLTQSVPARVGSGRKSVKYRAHALIHGQRLVSPSWAASEAVFNSTGVRARQHRSTESR